MTGAVYGTWIIDGVEWPDSLVIDRWLTAGDSLPKALGAESSIRAIIFVFLQPKQQTLGMDTETGESYRKLRLKDWVWWPLGRQGVRLVYSSLFLQPPPTPRQHTSSFWNHLSFVKELWKNYFMKEPYRDHCIWSQKTWVELPVQSELEKWKC